MDNSIEEYYKGTRANVADFLPNEYSKVLEIGCGAGGFRVNLKSNCEYWGVEPHLDAFKLATKKLDTTLNGTYDEVSNRIPDGYFDLIICNDVIEHMIDHDYFFSAIKQKMTANAYLVGSLPNVRFLPNLSSLIFERDWEYQNKGVLDRTHLRFFTKKSMLRTFQEHSFTVESFNGINNISFKPTSFRKIIKILTIQCLGKDTLSQQFAFRLSNQKN